MGLRRDREYCYAERKPCTAWAMLYFKDCLCSLRDEVSFALGLLSVTCWAFAEVPQIVTNFGAKSSQGVSLLLLLTWILGLVCFLMLPANSILHSSGTGVRTN